MILKYLKFKNKPVAVELLDKISKEESRPINEVVSNIIKFKGFDNNFISRNKRTTDKKTNGSFVIVNFNDKDWDSLDTHLKQMGLDFTSFVVIATHEYYTDKYVE